jgi:hypothetical protein
MRVLFSVRGSSAGEAGAFSGSLADAHFAELRKVDRTGWKPSGAATVVIGESVTVTVLKFVTLERAVDVVKIVSVDVLVAENVSVSWVDVRVITLVAVAVNVIVVGEGVMTRVGVVVVNRKP